MKATATQRLHRQEARRARRRRRCAPARRREGNRLCIRCGRRRRRHGRPDDPCLGFRGHFLHERAEVKRGILRALRDRQRKAQEKKVNEAAQKSESRLKRLASWAKSKFS